MNILTLLFNVICLNLLLISAILGDGDICTPIVLFKLSMFNERDANGKWRADVLLNKGSNETSLEERDFQLAVKQTVATCKCLTEVYSVEANIVAPPPRPGREYSHFGGNGYYRFHSTRATWSEGNTLCNTEGAHLAVVTSHEEAQRVRGILSERQEAVFVGFRRSTSGQLLTLYGDRQPFWGGFNPPDSVADDCGIIDSAGNLNITSCIERLPFFCEQEE